MCVIALSMKIYLVSMYTLMFSVMRLMKLIACLRYQYIESADS